MGWVEAWRVEVGRGRMPIRLTCTYLVSETYSTPVEEPYAKHNVGELIQLRGLVLLGQGCECL